MNIFLKYKSILQIIAKEVAMASELLFLSASTYKFAVFLQFSGTLTNKFGSMLQFQKKSADSTQIQTCGT